MRLQYNADVISTPADGHEDEFGIYRDAPLETQKDVREVLVSFQFSVCLDDNFPSFYSRPSRYNQVISKPL